MLVSEKIQIDDVTESGKQALFLVQTISDVSYYCKDRARYRPIDDRARYWANCFFLDKVWEVELRKFSEKKKKKRILARLEPILIPLTGQCNYH